MDIMAQIRAAAAELRAGNHVGALAHSVYALHLILQLSHPDHQAARQESLRAAEDVGALSDEELCRKAESLASGFEAQQASPQTTNESGGWAALLYPVALELLARVLERVRPRAEKAQASHASHGKEAKKH